jgi:hypothetical protein
VSATLSYSFTSLKNRYEKYTLSSIIKLIIIPAGKELGRPLMAEMMNMEIIPAPIVAEKTMRGTARRNPNIFLFQSNTEVITMPGNKKAKSNT